MDRLLEAPDERVALLLHVLLGIAAPREDAHVDAQVVLEALDELRDGSLGGDIPAYADVDHGIDADRLGERLDEVVTVEVVRLHPIPFLEEGGTLTKRVDESEIVALSSYALGNLDHRIFSSETTSSHDLRLQAARKRNQARPVTPSSLKLNPPFCSDPDPCPDGTTIFGGPIFS